MPQHAKRNMSRKFYKIVKQILKHVSAYGFFQKRISIRNFLYTLNTSFVHDVLNHQKITETRLSKSVNEKISNI